MASNAEKRVTAGPPGPARKGGAGDEAVVGLEPPTGGWRELAVGLRRHLRRIGQSLCLASGLLAGAELLARAAEPGPFSLWDKNPYQAGDKIRYRHRPGFTGRFDGTWYSINSRGLRGPELPPRGSTGGRVVVALGDSCTFGKGVLERESWPRRLEARVGQRGNNGSVTVANLGINGLSSRDYPRWYAEAGRPLEPEIVVLGFNINDFPNALAAADRAVQKRTSVRGLLPQGAWDALGRTALYRLTRGLFYELTEKRDWARAEEFARGAGQDHLLEESWAEVEGHLRELKQAVEMTGGRLALFLFPYESQVVVEEYESAPRDRLSQTCDELEVPFMDLVDVSSEGLRSGAAPDGLFLWGDHYHPNARGQDMVAEAVLGMITEQGWLD